MENSIPKLIANSLKEFFNLEMSNFNNLPIFKRQKRKAININ
jgi:hypothetical protein